MLGLPTSYAVAVVDRFTGAPIDLGGTARLEQVTYGRTRSGGAGSGQVSFAPSVMPDLRRLAAHPRRHNLMIWRDTPDPVFVGPVTGVTETDGAVTVQASDLLDWLDRRTLRALTAPIVGDVADVMRAILAEGLGGLDPIGHVARIEQTDVTKTVNSWTGARPYCSSEIRRLTSATMNLTAAGHRVFGWAIESDRGPTARVSPDLLGVTPAVSASTTNTATVIYARSGALLEQWPPAGAVDAVDGIVEVVLDARSIKDAGELREYAQAQWELRRWPTITVGLSDAAVLPPAFPLSIDELVPGVRIATQTAPGRNLTASGIFELNQLDVTIGTASGEIPRDAASGRFVTAGASVVETVTASWSAVIGKVTI